MTIETLIVHSEYRGNNEPMEVTILSDTHNYLSPQSQWAYERSVILAGWNPADKNMLMQASYKIDRFPVKSFAKGFVWAGNEVGWMDLGHMDVDEFWTWMPGWNRFRSERANRSGLTLVKDLVVVMHDIALESAWVQDLAATKPVIVNNDYWHGPDRSPNCHPAEVRSSALEGYLLDRDEQISTHPPFRP